MSKQGFSSTLSPPDKKSPATNLSFRRKPESSPEASKCFVFIAPLLRGIDSKRDCISRFNPCGAPAAAQTTHSVVPETAQQLPMRRTAGISQHPHGTRYRQGRKDRTTGSVIPESAPALIRDPGFSSIRHLIPLNFIFDYQFKRIIRI